jgi:hypothetical protein
MRQMASDPLSDIKMTDMLGNHVTLCKRFDNNKLDRSWSCMNEYDATPVTVSKMICFFGYYLMTEPIAFLSTST